MNRRPTFPFRFRGPALCELAFTAPFAALGGGLYGFDLAGDRGLPWMVLVPLFALSLVGFVAVQVSLEPWVVDRLGGRDGRWGALVVYLWDVVTGTVVGYPLVMTLGAPALPGVGLAVTAGAVYGYFIGWVVCGEGAGVAVTTLLTGSGIRPEPDHSRAQALEQRGEYDAALAAYREAHSADPGAPLPYLAMARLRERRGEREGAVQTLRDALARARLSPEQEVLCLRRLADMHADAGHPRGAAGDLARYLERRPDGLGAAWARAELRDIKDEVARDLDVPAPRTREAGDASDA